MRRSLKLTTSDWPLALCVLVLLLLTLFAIPHLPKVIGETFGLVISIGALWAMVDGLRARWRSAPNATSFFAYYGRLALLAVVILFAWGVIIYCIGRFYIS